MGSGDEGIRFVSSKEGCDEIISSVVAMRINLIPSFSRTYADNVMASTDPKSVSSL